MAEACGAAQLGAVPLRAALDAGAACGTAGLIARELGLVPVERARLTAVVTELAQLVLRAEREGLVRYELVLADQPAVRVQVEGLPPGSLRTSDEDPASRRLALVRRLVEDFFTISVKDERDEAVAWVERPLSGEQAAVDPEALAERVREHRDAASANAVGELVQQSKEVLHLLDVVRTREDQREALTRELEETNRGVVALYAELEETTNQLRQLNETLEQRVAERTAVSERRAKQLRALASELTQAENRERRRIVQALHDGLQQLLVAAKLRLAMVRSKAPEHLRPDLQGFEELLNESIQASRSLTVELCPPVLRQASLPTAIEWLAMRMEEKYGLHVEVERRGRPHHPLPETLKDFLFQAAQELLFNIVKHANVEQARVRVDAGDPDWVHVIIEDHGTGFDPAQAQREAGEGSGFGLFSIQERLEFFGGRFEIASKPGEGTRSRLIVPVATDETADGPPPSTRPAPSDGPAQAEPAGTRSSKIRVLLADDHKIVRSGLKTMIEAEPDIAVVAEAADGQEAIQLAQEHRPDVAIMDVNMPRTDGIDATRQIRMHVPQVRVIGLSMHTAEEIARAMYAAGAEDFITKEQAFESLCDRIRGS